MPKVRNAGGVGEKWANKASASAGEYEQGVRSPRASWAASSQAAKDAYKTGVTQAASEGRYEKGVSAAGDSAWQQGALDVGVGRFGSGVQAAQGKYQQKVDKYLRVIEGTSLPPRQSKGSPANLQRVSVMAEALRKAKTGK